MGNVTFKGFKWDKAGYRAIQDSAGVQSIVDSAAHSVCAAADAGLTDGGYAYPGHEVKTFQGTLATGRVVRTKTDQARYTQAKRKNLTKALGGV